MFLTFTYFTIFADHFLRRKISEHMVTKTEKKNDEQKAQTFIQNCERFNVHDNMENKKLRLLKYRFMLESNITLTVIIKYVSLGIIACIE